MKTTLISYVSFIAIFLQILILSVIISRSVYSQSIEDSLDESITVAMLLTQNSYKEHIKEYNKIDNKINWNEENNLELIKKDFINNLVDNIDSKITDLDINIYAADSENGILSVEVEATYKYLNGLKGKANCYKTLILNSFLE